MAKQKVKAVITYMNPLRKGLIMSFSFDRQRFVITCKYNFNWFLK